MRLDGVMSKKDYEELLRDGWLPEQDHVFVSYSGQDWEKVYPCVLAMRSRGINVYIDVEMKENGSSSWLKNFEDRVFRDSCCKGIVTFLSVDHMRSYPCLIEQVANHTYKLRKRRGRALPMFYVALIPEMSTVQKMAACIHDDVIQKESAKAEVCMTTPERSALGSFIRDSGFERYRDKDRIEELLDDMKDKLDVMTTMYELIFSQAADMPSILPFEGAEECAQLLTDNFINDKNDSIHLPVLEDLKRETEEKLGVSEPEVGPADEAALLPAPQEPLAGEQAAGQEGGLALPELVIQLIDRAEGGDPGSQDRLGWMYKEGQNGLERSLVKAAEWFRRAAEQGYAPAQKDLGWMYKEGWGLEKSLGEAAGWFRKAAEQGYLPAQKDLGWMYREGWGLEKSPEKAVEWFRRAAEQGYAPAQNELAWMYMRGQGGLEKSEEEVEKWIRKAAEQGYAAAQNELAWMYKNGQGGLERSAEKAVEWFRAAAEQGHSRAQYSLGLSYATGRGVEMDWTQAAHWYGEAARQGYRSAQLELAACYEKGRGVPQDQEKAAYWRDKAGKGKTR